MDSPGDGVCEDVAGKIISLRASHFPGNRRSSYKGLSEYFRSLLERLRKYSDRLKLDRSPLSHGAPFAARYLVGPSGNSRPRGNSLPHVRSISSWHRTINQSRTTG